MSNKKDEDKYRQRAMLLREALKRQKVEVRDVVRVLHLNSTSHALLIMRELVTMGYLEYDPPQGDARYGDYFFPVKQGEQHA